MEYKICKLSWTGDKYSVLYRVPGSGWKYVSKCLDKPAAEKLYNELTTVL